MQVNASSFGLPAMPSTCERLDGQPIAWIPGMKADAHDWRLLLWHSGDIRRYRSAGGDMSKAIVHWLSRDDGTIEPLWGKTSFARRVEQMEEAGVKRVVAPDFSSWADMPIAAQAHNYYRSAVVSHDLAHSGFEVVANVCWSAPQLHQLSIGMWAGVSFALIDANHFSPHRRNYNHDLFWSGAAAFKERNPGAFCWIYSSYRQTADYWRERVGPCAWRPSRVAVLNQMRTHRRKAAAHG